MAVKTQSNRDLEAKIRLARKNEYGLVKKKDHITGEIIQEFIDKEIDDVTPLVEKMKSLGYKDEYDEDGHIDYTADTDNVDEYIKGVKRPQLSVREKALQKIIVSFVNNPKVKDKLSKDWYIKRKEVDAVSKWVTENYLYEVNEVVDVVKKLFS